MNVNLYPDAMTMIRNYLLFIIWGLALFFYMLFLAWHENWRGPLNAQEVDFFMARVNASKILDATQKRDFQSFMLSDKGDEFFMLNLAAYPAGNVAHPLTGEAMPPTEMLENYYRPFIGKILRSGGYPSFIGAVKGGYLDKLAAPANPGWSGLGIIRYRSRRDLLEAATGPDFADSHIFKQAALAATYAMPVETHGGLFLSPRLWVFFLLGGVAGLAHILTLTLRMKNVRQI